jgi:hypothetical protein
VIENSYFDRQAEEIAVERDGLEMTFLDAHRPLEDYSRALEDAGFLVERVREVEDTTEAPAHPSIPRWRRIPLFLHIRAVAGAVSSSG